MANFSYYRELHLYVCGTCWTLQTISLHVKLETRLITYILYMCGRWTRWTITSLRQLDIGNESTWSCLDLFPTVGFYLLNILHSMIYNTMVTAVAQKLPIHLLIIKRMNSVSTAVCFSHRQRYQMDSIITLNVIWYNKRLHLRLVYTCGTHWSLQTTSLLV